MLLLGQRLVNIVFALLLIYTIILWAIEDGIISEIITYLHLISTKIVQIYLNLLNHLRHYLQWWSVALRWKSILTF